MRKAILPAAVMVGVVAIVYQPLLAQDNQQPATGQAAASEDQSQTWRNPDRIADIEDESERIRAFSVLIGQSVYDLMPHAQSDTAMQSADTAQGDEATEGAEGTEVPGAVGATQDSQVLAVDGLAVTVVNVSSSLDAADVRALEALAERNRQELLALQSAIELDEELKAKLEDEGLLPADVVGIQRSSGTLDIFVIPDWLNE